MGESLFRGKEDFAFFFEKKFQGKIVITKTVYLLVILEFCPIYTGFFQKIQGKDRNYVGIYFLEKINN